MKIKQYKSVSMMITSTVKIAEPSRNTLHKKIKTQYFFPLFQPIAVSDMKPLPEDRRYDIVLLDQGYRTPQGAAIHQYGATVK
jgi:hypothetical protein